MRCVLAVSARVTQLHVLRACMRQQASSSTAGPNCRSAWHAFEPSADPTPRARQQQLAHHANVHDGLTCYM